MAGKFPFSRFFQKAASNYYVTVFPNQPNFSNIFSTRGNVTADQLVANFETIPDIFSVENNLSEFYAHLPVKVVKKSGKEAKNSELYKLIEEPNPFESWEEVVAKHFIYYGITGNSFLYGIRPVGFDTVSSIYVLPVEMMKVILARDKSLPQWMNEVAGYEMTIGGRTVNIPMEMVLHEKSVSLRYNDGSWIYGMSKYIPGDKIARELKAIHDAKTSVIENRGAMGFVTNESEVPDPTQSKEVKAKLNESYGLLDGQDKIIVTTEKLRWQQMALGLQELQLIENAKYSYAKICEINGFDPVVFSADGSTFANKEAAIKHLFLKVIKPKADKFYKALSNFVAPNLGEEIVVAWERVEEMQADRKVMTELLTKQIECSIVTPKEARELLYPEMIRQESDEMQVPDVFLRRTSLVLFDEPEPQQPDQLPDVRNMIDGEENPDENMEDQEDDN